MEYKKLLLAPIRLRPSISRLFAPHSTFQSLKSHIISLTRIPRLVPQQRNLAKRLPTAQDGQFRLALAHRCRAALDDVEARADVALFDDGRTRLEVFLGKALGDLLQVQVGEGAKLSAFFDFELGLNNKHGTDEQCNRPPNQHTWLYFAFTRL